MKGVGSANKLQEEIKRGEKKKEEEEGRKSRKHYREPRDGN